MSGCPSGAKEYQAAQRPLAEEPMGAQRPATDFLTEVLRWHDYQRRETRRHANEVNRVANQFDPDTPPGEAPTARERSQLNNGARDLQKLIDQAIAAEGIAPKEFESAQQRLSGTTVADAGFWLKATNKIAKAFAHKEAEFNLFAMTNFGSEGRTINNNPLIAAFNSIAPRKQGAMQNFHIDATTNVAKKWESVANRLGMDADELLYQVGFFANGQHAPEVNAHLLRKWRADIGAEQAKINVENNKAPERRKQRVIRDAERTIRQREGWIADLEANLETLRERDANGAWLNPETGKISQLRSSGMTNAEARDIMQQILDRTGLTRAEAEAIAADQRAFNQRVTETRIAEGLIPPEVVARFPEFNVYVPFKSKLENTSGVMNNSNVYNPGRDYMLEGRTDAPTSAWDSILHHAQRTANEIGMREFGTTLAAAKRVADLQGRDAGRGIISRDYNQFMQRKLNGSEFERAAALRIESEGAIVVDAPTYDANGNQSGVSRQIMYFDPQWTDARTGLTGTQLNQAMVGAIKVEPRYSMLATGTSWYGQTFTRLNPAFAPANMIRDTFERSINMAGRDYYTAEGELIHGSSLVGSYLANMYRSGKWLGQVMTGSADANSPAMRYWNEYVTNGAHQQYTQGMLRSQHRSIQDMIDGIQPRTRYEEVLSKPGMGGVKEIIDTAGAGRDAILRRLDNYNDYFNNVAIFNQFVTLREAGLTPRAAATATIEMLNLYQGGTFQPMLSTLFPFVKPTVQTGVQLTRTLGLAPMANGKFRPNTRGIAAIAGAGIAYNLLLPLVKEGMGRDENGNLRFDNFRFSDVTRFVPFSLGDDGGYLKFPTGFGAPQLAAVLAVGIDRVTRGMMSPSDLAFELLYTAAKNVTPGDWPEFSAKAQPSEWLTYAFTPTIIKPIFAPTDFMGRKITDADADGLTPRAMQGRLGTEQVYHRWAKTIHETTGIDLAPEQVKNWMRHLAVGPLRGVKVAIEADELRTGSAQKNAAQTMGAWLTAMGATLWYGKSVETGRAMYYQALEKMEEQIRDKGIQLRSTEYGNDVRKREQYQRRVLTNAGFDDDFIHDFLLTQATNTQIKSNHSKFAREIRPIIASSDDSDSVKEAFTSLADRQLVLYTDAVNRMRFYENRR